jgi:hypothetical protein
MAKKAIKKNYKKGKNYLPKVKSKVAKTNYTGPTPRQNLALAKVRKNEAEDVDGDGSENYTRRRRIASY